MRRNHLYNENASNEGWLFVVVLHSLADHPFINNYDPYLSEEREMKTRSLFQMKLIGIAAIIMLLVTSCTGITSLYRPTAPATLVPTPTPTEVPSGLPPTIGLPLAGAEVVYIPGGSFLMGSQKEDPNAKPDELPMHRVLLKAYYIMTKEVTNEAYLGCVKSGGCTPPKNN
jgi:formylglycine-generating enzyme required for sulfatase activity